MKLSKEAYQNIIKTIVFLLILSLLFLCFTYLFRETMSSKRGNILNYYNEPEDSLDVVVIGASNVIRYWDPMRAWHDYGITSYNYATTAMGAGTYFAGLKDALKTQNPELVIMETRLFAYSDKKNPEVTGARHLLDSLDVGFSRFQAAKYYCDTLGISWKDAIPLYIDLMYYHTNYDALFDAEHWELVDNRAPNSINANKGYFPYADVAYYEDPTSNLTEEIGALGSNTEKFFTDILDYCRDEDIPLLLIATPVVIQEIESKRFNRVAQIAEEYGVPFLDANLYYEQIGLDFSEDFADDHHTNTQGADKYTDFLAKYLAENYDFPDHREDPRYADWNAAYEQYTEISNKSRKKLADRIAKRDQALANGESMKLTDDPAQWLCLADDEEFTLFILSGQPSENMPCPQSELLLKNFGIEEDYWKNPFTVVYQSQTVQRGMNRSFSGTVGNDALEYFISAEDEIKIQIGDADYTAETLKGIQFVAYSNSLNKVMDQIVMTVCPDGSLSVVRK